MYLDALLSMLHWWAVLGLVAILVVERALLGGPLDARGVRRLVGYDLAYLVFALLTIAAGFTRATLGAKGWTFYSSNPAFWTKIALFAAIAALSVPPTIAMARWKKALAAPATVIEPAAIARVRRWVDAELALLVLIPIAAALMARGIGH